MKNSLKALFILLIGISSFQGQGQTVLEKGTVSFVSSRNVYVKFSSTENINIGDTLFIGQKGGLSPALVVGNKSSTSTVCSPLPDNKMKVSDEVFAKTTGKKETQKPEEKTAGEPPSPPADMEKVIAAEKVNPVITPEEDEGELVFKQKVRGRISAASYSNFSDYQNTHRMRYAFSFRGDNLKNSKFSTDTYITFRHTLNEWEKVQENLGYALKVYALSVKYDFNPTSSLTFGRRINPKISSLGAIDGLQYEKGWGNFIVGAIAGSRPDYSEYGMNTSLLQAGAYVGFGSKAHERHHQSTLGVVEQRNKLAVDRRFVYFQHSDELLENLNLFGSMEMDLYQLVNSEASMQPSLTNLFASLRYRFSRNWNLSLSYDNRKNIIYYESYKTYLDQLIDQETRQGLRLGMNMRPAKWLSCGLTGSWRFQKSKANDAKNLNSYLNFNRIPLLKASATLTANYLQSGYLNGTTFGLRLMKDVFKGKLNLELSYRRVDYTFPFYGYSTNQNIVGGSLTWSIFKKLGFYVFVENTFDSQGNDYLLVNTKLMQRF